MDTEAQVESSDSLSNINTPSGVTLQARDGIVVQRDALTVDIEDSKFIEISNALINGTKNFNEKKYNLTARREEMEMYLFGRQLKNRIFKDYESPYVDNIIYEAEAYLKPMALSRMPDLIVKPGNEGDEAQHTAEDVTSVIDTDIKSRERRRVLGIAFKQMPVGLIAGIKYFWNPEKGKKGDYDFRNVHYENLVLDHTAATNDQKDMGFVAEAIEYTVKEWVMRFPSKEKAFYEELHNSGKFNDTVNENTETGMNTKIKGWEIWYKWYERVGDEWQLLNGVGWYYKNVVFGKMLNPNWDWEGTKQTFKYDEANGKKIAPTEQELISALTGDKSVPIQSETYYRNHLDSPEFPYIFLGYDQWGKSPLDETSRIEQNIFKQKAVDTRGTQINEMLNRSRGKHIFSAIEGLTAEDIQAQDLNDPNEDVLVKGKVNDVHSFVPAEQPSAQMIQNLDKTTERIFSTSGVNGAVRGNVQTDVATTNQIAREGDFTRVDDLTDDTINYAAEKMANAILQLIKLRYTEDHFVKVLGDDGRVAFKKVNRDMIQDGMEVSITASGTDKLKAEQRAMDMAKLKLIDPLTFYKDMGMSDPRGRTEKLLIFTLSPELYLQKFVRPQEGQGAALAGALDAQNPAMQGDGGTQQAQQDIMMITQGQIPPLPPMVSPGYLQAFTNFMDTQAKQVMQQFPNIGPQLIQFAEGIQKMAQQSQGGGQPTPVPNAAPQPATPAPAGNVGPTTGNPQPGNTQQVNITPPGM